MVKCPFCPPDNIKGTSHLEEYHKLREKIHEKIESLEKPTPKDYKPMFSQEFIFIDFFLQELKSLLDSSDIEK